MEDQGPAPSPPTEIIEGPGGTKLRRVRKLRVEIVASPDATAVGASHVLVDDEVRVGSDPDAGIHLADASVSREHLAVRLTKDGWAVADLGSTNGTFLGDLRVERLVVSREIVLSIGRSQIKLTPLGEVVEQEISQRARFGRLVGASAIMRQTFAVLEKVAPSDLTVLVEGETGTGKELAAEGIHGASARAGGPFIALNCGAIPRELVESELFGHERGAFTGAVRSREGAFVAADGGTLFLDEIGELPIDLQAKLLRALERREVKPVGADQPRKVDVRLVAATHKTLAREVAAGAFRQDLYYRLAVVVVRLPPLRARADDLPLLVDTLREELDRRRASQGLAVLPALDAHAMAMLARYDFPGNVRELRNIVERWAVLGAAGMMGDAPPPASGGSATASHADVPTDLPYHEAKDVWLERFERAYVEAVLAKTDGNVSAAARIAGVDRRHLQRVMARYGLREAEADG